MRRAGVATAAVVLAVMGAWLGFAQWSGRTASAQLEQQTRDLVGLSPSFKLIKQATSHGLFSSQHDVTLQLGCLPAAEGSTKPASQPRPLLLSWRSVVKHGPLPGGSPAVAVVESELITPDLWKAELEQLAGKQPLLRAHSKVGFTGDLVSQVTLAGLHWSDPVQGSFVSQPVQAKLMGSIEPGGQGSDSYVLDVPRVEMTVRGPDHSTLELKVGRVLAETVLGKRANAKLWLRPSKTTAFVSSVVADGSVADAAGAPRVRSRASWDGVKLSAESTLDKGMLASRYAVTTKGKVNDFGIDKVELASSVKNVDAAALQRALVTLSGTTLSCEPTATRAVDAILPALQQELSALIANNPELSVDNLELDLGDQRAKLAYSAGTHGVDAADRATPVLALLAQKGFLRGKLQIHMGMVELLANKVVNYDSKPGQQTSLERTSGIVKGVIDNFIRQGYLERSGQEIRVAIAYEGGQLLINGKAKGLPALSLPTTP